MDLYGQPVQEIYHTFLHLSGSINNTGSVVYDGRGHPSIITISTDTCKLAGRVIVNNVDFSLPKLTSVKSALSSSTVLSFNNATSAVEIRSLNTLVPKRQKTFILSSVELPAFDANIFNFKTTLIDQASPIFLDMDMPNNDDECLTVQKFYYQGILREVIYDIYRYSNGEWSYIITV